VLDVFDVFGHGYIVHSTEENGKSKIENGVERMAALRFFTAGRPSGKSVAKKEEPALRSE